MNEAIVVISRESCRIILEGCLEDNCLATNLKRDSRKEVTSEDGKVTVIREMQLPPLIISENASRRVPREDLKWEVEGEDENDR